MCQGKLQRRGFHAHAERLANRLGRGEEGGLCIGYIENAMHAGVLPNALRVLRDDRPGVVLRELPWLTYTTPLWAAWHRVNLRPLVETFRKVLTDPQA